MIHQAYRHKLVAKSTAALVMVGAFASMGLVTEASAATFIVNSTVDSVDSNPGNGVCADASGNCTLKAAIMEANALAGTDTINLAPGGTYTLTAVDNTWYYGGPTGLPWITSVIIINGGGATIQRSSTAGTPDFRIFYIGGPAGDLTLNEVTIRGGRSASGAPGYIGGGGGLRIDAGKLLLVKSTVTDSWGNEGGGIYNFCGTLIIENSTISRNTGFGGRTGGGVLNFSSSCQATTTIINSTIFENRADGPPGFQGRGDAIADAFSPAGSIVVKNSILASPTQGMGNDCHINNSVLTSQGNNIASDNSCGLTGSGDRNGIDPLLGSLAANGGPTMTHALLAGSPALNAVPLTNCTTTAGTPLAIDQRGTARPQGPACDIGAFEATNIAESWTPTGATVIQRAFSGVAKLPSGKILVVGGYNFNLGYLNSVDLYNPVTGTWTLASPMPTSHRLIATALPNGDVLALGDDTGDPKPTAYRYNEGTGSWSSAGTPSISRFSPVSVVLSSGKVLLAGGYVGGPGVASGTYATAEVFDSATNTWSPVASMGTSRFVHTGTLLPNGKVLVAGGSQRDGPTLIYSSAELFDPTNSTWTSTAPMSQQRASHTATLLPSGKVLVTGGYASDYSIYQATAELFDPSSNTWSSAAPMGTTRIRHTAVLLESGKVLVAGGRNSGGELSSAEVYDPATNTWTPAPSMSNARDGHVAAALPGGKVLVAGGLTTGGATTASAEIYQVVGPVVDTTPPVITTPAYIAVDATSPAGALVAYVASATDDSGTVSSFACLPGSASIFPAGDTQVMCTAFDVAGNMASKSFTVTVIGASAQLAKLVAIVNGFGLPKGIETSLLAQLSAAGKSNPPASCNQLQAFMNDVKAQSGKALTAAQASQLVSAAQKIFAAFGC